MWSNDGNCFHFDGAADHLCAFPRGMKRNEGQSSISLPSPSLSAYHQHAADDQDAIVNKRLLTNPQREINGVATLCSRNRARIAHLK
jgi:hypothetical protein